MEQRVILQDSSRCICFIQDADFSFYLNIPNSRRVQLVLELSYGVSEEVVKNYLNNSSFAIITPVLGEKIFDGIKQNNVEFFNYLDGLLSKIINLTYNVLSYNKLDIDHLILLNNNTSFSMFNTWFVQKYDGRVLLSLVNLGNNTLSSDDLLKKEEEVVVPTQVNVPSTNQLDDINVENDLDSLDGVVDKGDFGFISYVLLGVVVAVGSLIFLYFII